ncbi:MAG: hypothetical protein LBL21_04735, partial [Rickettsiales bacterium]|nr:hypothetical protein [Rickettsiales bacterium]
KGGVIISEAGPENSKDGGKMSLNDGIKVGGVFMPVAGFRNIFATDMILGCMDSGASRYECQCGVDNTFRGMDAEEVLAFIKNPDRFQDKIDGAKKYCLESPKSKIPPTNGPGGMLGGEIRAFILKEVLLDCVEGGESEKSCRCYADGAAKLPAAPRKYLEVIDARKTDMSKYRPNDKKDAAEIERLRKTCGLK